MKGMQVTLPNRWEGERGRRRGREEVCVCVCGCSDPDPDGHSNGHGWGNRNGHNKRLEMEARGRKGGDSLYSVDRCLSPLAEARRRGLYTTSYAQYE